MPTFYQTRIGRRRIVSAVAGNISMASDATAAATSTAALLRIGGATPLLAAVSGEMTTTTALMVQAAGGTPLPSEKFIKTFAMKWGGSNSAYFEDAPSTARLDLLFCEPWYANVSPWVEGSLNGYQSIRQYNSDIVIALYILGPGAYEASEDRKAIGQNWSWIQANHGLGQTGSNRWVGWNYAGSHPSYLSGEVFTNQRSMYPGASGWRQYWREQVYSMWWGGGKGLDVAGCDGLFIDITGFQVTDWGTWLDDNGNANTPIQYGSSTDPQWVTDMTAFFNEAVPYLLSRSTPVKMCPNFGNMDASPGIGRWQALDGITNPPTYAMVEAGFVQRYGPSQYCYKIFSYNEKISTIAGMQNVAVCVKNHGDFSFFSTPVGGSGDIARMSESHPINLGGSITGWEVLWFCLMSGAICRNAANDNVLIGFTLWGYTRYHTFDEQDPAYIHLGQPVGSYYISSGAYFREYDDGWVVTNPTTSSLSLSVPSGTARVINHNNFKNPTSASLVSSFSLSQGRGVILLKPGHNLGA